MKRLLSGSRFSLEPLVPKEEVSPFNWLQNEEAEEDLYLQEIMGGIHQRGANRSVFQSDTYLSKDGKKRTQKGSSVTSAFYTSDFKLPSTFITHNNAFYNRKESKSQLGTGSMSHHLSGVDINKSPPRQRVPPPDSSQAARKASFSYLRELPSSGVHVQRNRRFRISHRRVNSINAPMQSARDVQGPQAQTLEAAMKMMLSIPPISDHVRTPRQPYRRRAHNSTPRLVFSNNARFSTPVLLN
eukprot:TRINITY_DN22754_c0_g1_i1.p1 TRINITY_DN22754_c0_g1~~TRINITY_DN22754_c0_g1_i1.p1  ORF type:complete len:242 (-),score=19.18 TRINITY_DN22754_c0_g1_i1:197-922(-)